MQERSSGVQKGTQAGVAQGRSPLKQEVSSSSTQGATLAGARKEMPVRPRVSPTEVRREVPAQELPREDNPRVMGQGAPAASAAADTNAQTTRRENPARSQSEASAREAKNRYSTFLPLLGVALTMLLMVAFQTIQLSMDRDILVTVKQNQEGAVSESKKVRLQFESIVKGTGQLAANGNKNAQAVVEQLRKQGITINHNQP